jgi:hypothetical protein
MFTPRNVIIIITSIAVLGIGINAFAHNGMGWGGSPKMGSRGYMKRYENNRGGYRW